MKEPGPDYIVVVAFELQKLELEVNKKLSDSYQPIGGVFVDQSGAYLQAMWSSTR